MKIQNIKIKFEQNSESKKNRVQSPKIFNKLEKTEIKININKGTDYNEMFKIMRLKSLQKKENMPPKKQNGNLMMEILKIKKKDTLRDVQNLEKEISNLEKEKARESKYRLMENQEYFNKFNMVIINLYFLKGIQDIRKNISIIQEK